MTENNPDGVNSQYPEISIVKIASSGWNVDDENSKTNNSRCVVTLPKLTLPPEDARLLEAWTPSSLQQIIMEITRFVKYGSGWAKRDVGPNLDPLQRKMISMSRGQELFEA